MHENNKHGRNESLYGQIGLLIVEFDCGSQRLTLYFCLGKFRNKLPFKLSTHLTPVNRFDLRITDFETETVISAIIYRKGWR